MDLWNRISGILWLELTCGDLEGLLNEALRNHLTLYDIRLKDAICGECCISRRDFGRLRALADKWGASWKIVRQEGLFYYGLAWLRRPVILGVLFFLTLASVYLPGRILFVQVEGNNVVPSRLILERAGELGLGFGASRREVRSERIKNELLGAIEKLEWVGVNTSGSVATISVRERKMEEEPDEDRFCNLVAVCDGVVETVTLIRGEVKCVPGQAVRKGEILVGGLLDLGICTKAVEAEGEIYARTLRQSSAAIPKYRTTRIGEGDQITKYSLLIGKKRINLYSDSGILMPTCGKMSTVYQLRLPGGFELPVALVREVYTLWQTQPQPVAQEEALHVLSDAMNRNLMRHMVAGKIVDCVSRMEPSERNWMMSASYECREMIARQDEGVYLQNYG